MRMCKLSITFGERWLLERLAQRPGPGEYAQPMINRQLPIAARNPIGYLTPIDRVRSIAHVNRR